MHSKSILGWFLAVGLLVPLAQADVITVATIGGDYSSFDGALTAADPGDTIRFLDDAIYSVATAPHLSDEGLTIESVTNHRATIDFVNATGPGSEYWGVIVDGDNITLRNLNLISARTTLMAAGGGLNTTVSNVSVSVSTAAGNGMETGNGMSIVDSTFLGGAAGSSGGRAVSWSDRTVVSIDHCSFDTWKYPIIQPSAENSSPPTYLTVSNCAFGAWYGASYAAGVVVDGTYAQLVEDYNASYGPNPFIRTNDLAKVTSGGHSFTDTYAGVFPGSTAAGDWTVGGALIYAAADGTTIGAWQRPELTVGAGGNYASFEDALVAATLSNDVIRILDSATYATTNAPYLRTDGLTIMTVEGERATLSFLNATGTGDRYYGMIQDSDGITLSNLNVHAERTTIIAAAGGMNSSFLNVNFVNTGGGNGVETLDGTRFEYCTFLGTGATSGGGIGVSWSYGTAVTVDHCSFDQLDIPIKNPDGDASTTIDVTDSAFGAWRDYVWSGGITIGGLPATGFEDYNASYGPRPFIRAGDLAKVTSGGNSINYCCGAGTYGDVFVDNTGNGEWRVASTLRRAASDGRAIGAWQLSFSDKPTLFIAK